MKSGNKGHIVPSRRYPAQFTRYISKVKVFRRKWTFHKYDKDFSPSVPHGHSGSYKLNVMTGEVFAGSSDKPVGHASKKDLDALHHDKKFQEYTRDHILWYREAYPDIPVQYPEWLREPPRPGSVHIVHRTNDADSITYLIRTIHF